MVDKEVSYQFAEKKMHTQLTYYTFFQFFFNFLPKQTASYIFYRLLLNPSSKNIAPSIFLEIPQLISEYG